MTEATSPLRFLRVSMIAKGKRSIIWLLLIGFVVSLAGAGVAIWNRPTFVPPTLPEPNGYEKLLVASEMLHPKTGSYDELGTEKLAEVVAHNKPALVLVRMGLNEECMVTLVWGGDRTWHDTVHTARNAKNRNIARAFAAAARHESLLGNTDVAIQCGLDGIRSGRAVAEGGLIVDWYVGHANVYLGMATLRSLVDSLTKQQAKELINRIEDSLFEFEDPNSLLERELAYFREMHSSMEWLMLARVAQKQQQTMRNEFPTIQRRHATYRDLLVTHLALRCYEIDHQRLPDELGELVPGYLSELPVDSFSEGTLKYRRQEEGYVLYGVGPNEVDDGGIESTSAFDGDVLLESPWN